MGEVEDKTTYGNMELHWPPTENDFMKVMESALHKNTNWENVLIFVKNYPDIMQFDPVTYGHSEVKSMSFKTEDGKKYNVILSEID